MKSYLIVNPFGIGDAIFSLAAAEKIRQSDSEARIGFVCNERTEELLRLCPALNRLHVFNRDALRSALKKSPFLFFSELKKLVGDVSSEKYDALIDFSLGREFSLAAWFAGIRRRVGFDYKGRGLFLTHKKKIRAYTGSLAAQQQIDLLTQFDIVPDNRLPVSLEIRVEEPPYRLEAGQRILSVAPGGGKSWGPDARYKQWDSDKFADAVNELVAQDAGLKVILLGDEAEKPLLEEVSGRLRQPALAVMAGEPVAKVCAVLKKSALLLCNDGGLMHLAHALGVKVTALFGPVDEKVYGPGYASAAYRVVTQGVPCRPCYQNFRFPGCPYERRCLAEISPHKVVEAVREIL